MQIDPNTEALLGALAHREGRSPDQQLAHIVRLYGRHFEFSTSNAGGLFADAQDMPRSSWEGQGPAKSQPATHPPVRLGTAVSDYLNDPSRPERSASSQETYAKAIKAAGFTDQTDAATLTRTDARAAVQKMLDDGLKPGSVNLYLSSLSTVARYLVREEMIAKNVFDGLKVHDAEAGIDKKLPLTDEDIKRIIASPEFVRLSDHRKAGFVALLYLGCRSGEWFGLREQDLGVFQGHQVVRFTSHEGRALKNKASERTVPIPPELVTHLKRWKPDFSSYDKAASPALNRIISRYAEQPERKSLHSTRHRFSTMCRELSIPPQIRDRIAGWTPAKSGTSMGDTTYGDRIGVKELVPWAERIFIPVTSKGLSLD